jgi:dTDP-4-amino-4,6-dideoxygalactose transaminase
MTKRISQTGRWPCYSENEIDAAIEVLRSGKVNYWTGDNCKKFETEFADFCNARYAVALSNGTVALELALRALNIKPGDEVIVPCRTFIATATSVINAGAKPVFADVDQYSQNITADTIRVVLSPRTKAIIAVHLGGWPCDMDSIMPLARKHKLKVIEDCAQAHGARYKGKPVGSLGDAAAFSFCQDKIISTGGEGGMLVTNDSETWKKAWSYKDHGKSYQAVFQKQHPPGFRWVHYSIGSNWRMTEVQAAIGRLQLKKLTQWHRRRNLNAFVMSRRFREIPALQVVQPPSHIDHAYYKYDAFLKPDTLNDEWNRERLLTEINAKGVPCFAGICPEVYMEKAFDAPGLRPAKRFPVARKLGDTGMTFLVHPTLGEKEIEAACDVVESVMLEAVKTKLPRNVAMEQTYKPVVAKVLHTHT